jgi:hypothetical protein
MLRRQLEHAIRAACAILGVDSVIIVGSQSVLGTWDEYQLPGRATLTNEADVLAIDDDNDRVMMLADQLDGAAGEMSQFHQTHGFYIDGVDLTTSVLPSGWRERLVAVCTENTNYCTGWCLEPHDLCVAKLIAYREKDREFVDALIAHGLIDPDVVRGRLDDVPAGHEAAVTRARSWVSS